MDKYQSAINQSGQTLIEALVALGVVVVLISAAVVAVISALSNSQYSKNQNLATQYAQEGMELVKKDNNLDPGLIGLVSSGTKIFCLGQGLDLTSSTPAPSIGTYCTISDPNIDKVFIRQITITQSDSLCNYPTGSGTSTTNVASAKVDVKWADGKCNSSSNLYCHDVQLISCFSNSNAVPTL